MVQIAEKRRLRVSSLNHAKVSLDIAEDDLVDDEDAGTKYVSLRQLYLYISFCYNTYFFVHSQVFYESERPLNRTRYRF